MVYCGKPSRGCQMCRARRIKCDETKPTCNQCAKSRRQCPGYKDEFDLVFRNETQATERRARKANKKAMAQKQGKATSSRDAPKTSTTTKPNPDQSIITTLQLPVDQQATCHFLSNFVLLPSHDSTRGWMEFVVPLLKAEKPAPHFKLAFDACAVASLGNRVGPGSNFESEALGHYTKALAATFTALKDPEARKEDSTLAAVLLLGLFENITAKQLGMLAWGSHIEGAIQLVKARDKKQSRTKTGLALFVATRTQMIIHTLSTGKAPIMGVEWWITDGIKNRYGAECQRLNIRTAELRAEVNRLMTTLSRSPENVELLLDMIRRCQTLDQHHVNWINELPEYFRFKAVAWEDHVPNGNYALAEVFPGRVDAYQDLWVVSVWNLMRCSRIILASLIVRCAAWVCSPVDYRTTPEYATAARACVDMITDIIASVPYQLGWFSKRKELLERANLSAFGCGEEDALKGLPGYFLTWPLTCVQGQDYTTDAQRAWVKGRLQFIGNQLGVRYANILNQLNLRVPSMLIRRDGLMANPYPMAHNFEKLLSARSAPPSAGYSMNPIQQREAMHKEQVEREKTELLTKAMGSLDKLDETVADGFLHLKSGAALRGGSSAPRQQ
ncbi:Zn(2)-C6 fungal-type domain-containing protein [Fusarium keratoplasticum]|uniref:Zn(2)-C6 fungal-type domain-containing protein n=1 Tax=Fusarium keratoplasticum TaxID=1328300 RepID=A0ACC0QZ77_9HYPO|nr:Zn(2)-C6 fungal-type domain-containing protein [Fusarium keratoplasticum]KAI8670789.1 Zn(2)-C6 fungal-type domain-containing protein [Fusarium keratoplasticum]